jgi:carboxyl-terminal processing protease
MLGPGPGGQGVIVQHIVPNSPAAEAGITNGVIITKMDDVSVEGKRLADCVNLIRGPVGSTMRLELVMPDHSQTNTVELTRKKLSL